MCLVSNADQVQPTWICAESNVTVMEVIAVCDMIITNVYCTLFSGRDAIAVKQAHVDKLYASLKDLAGDRRLKLDEVLKLYMLNRDIEDLEQWIAEREVVAGSHELGQDFEHVTVSQICFNTLKQPGMQEPVR